MATISPAPSRANGAAPKSDWPYRDEFAVIRPLTIQNPVGEKAAVTCYLQMKDDGLEEWTFPGIEHPTLQMFLNCCQQGFILGMDAAEKNIVGFGSLLELEYPEKNERGLGTNGKASGMYCFFREWHRSPVIRHAAHLALRYWFEDYRLRLIMGTALERNTSARMFGKRLGFVECGTVPSFFWKAGKPEAAVALALEREKLLGIERERLFSVE